MINFEVTFYLKERSLPWKGPTLILLTLAILVLGWKAWELKKRVSQIGLEVSAIEQRLKVSISHTSQAPKEEKLISPNTVARLSTPWELLLDTLADITPLGLKVTGLTPDPDRQSLTWSVEGKDVSLVAQYLEEVNRSHALRNAYIVRQSMKSDLSSPSAPLNPQGNDWQFVLRAEWIQPARFSEKNTFSAAMDGKAHVSVGQP